MSVSKRIASSPFLKNVVGIGAAEYLRFVRTTNQFVVDPPDFPERVRCEKPFIAAFWHGQHLMMPFTNPNCGVKCLISRHRDGEINAIVARRLGIGAIRGSGSHIGDFWRKGAVSGFRAMLDALDQGYIVASTADVPKVARMASVGLIKLARTSGRPIYPISVATSRYFELSNWDRTVVNLPFGRGAMVFGGEIHVPANADDAKLEKARQALEHGLNSTTAQAYDMVGQQQRLFNSWPSADAATRAMLSRVPR